MQRKLEFLSCVRTQPVYQKKKIIKIGETMRAITGGGASQKLFLVKPFSYLCEGMVLDTQQTQGDEALIDHPSLFLSLSTLRPGLDHSPSAHNHLKHRPSSTL